MSFKRKTPSKQVAIPPGTRTCPISTSTILTSSGIPSLDDILGGGVPLSCSLAILAPDPQSAYGELVQKYFIAQGIANGDRVYIVHEDGLSFAAECMWMPASRSSQPIPVADEGDATQNEEKIKIAWRYERMKKFETTVTNASADDFCGVFDLSCRIPKTVIDEAHDARRLIPLNLDPTSSMNGRVREIEHVLGTTPSTEVVRLSITTLGSPDWGEHYPADILWFLYSLRRLLRRYPHACACVSLAPHICTDLWGGSGWTQKVGWVTDATISMSGFGANPMLTTLFPSQHGLVQIDKLPAPHSIQATSDRYSALRGLSSSAAANIGTGENNLAFKCTRKRLIFETMHLDFEGGVSERRTTPSTTAVSLDSGLVHTHVSSKEKSATLASVAVEFEETAEELKSRSERLEGQLAQSTETGLTRKKKKKVAFHSEKPDLYDF